LLVDARRFGVAVGPVEENHPSGVPVGLQEVTQELLRPSRFSEDYRPAGRSDPLHLGKADFDGCQKRPGLGIDADTVCPLNVSRQFVDLGVELLYVDLGRLFCRKIALALGFFLTAVEELVQQFPLDLLVLDDPLDEAQVGLSIIPQGDEAVPHALQCSGQCP